jgi:hypothetical protein
VKCILRGEPARVVRELQERGLVKSVREAVVQGLLALADKVTEQELRRAQARASKRLEEDGV